MYMATAQEVAAREIGGKAAQTRGRSCQGAVRADFPGEGALPSGAEEEGTIVRCFHTAMHKSHLRGYPHA